MSLPTINQIGVQVGTSTTLHFDHFLVKPCEIKQENSNTYVLAENSVNTQPNQSKPTIGLRLDSDSDAIGSYMLKDTSYSVYGAPDYYFYAYLTFAHDENLENVSEDLLTGKVAQIGIYRNGYLVEDLLGLNKSNTYRFTVNEKFFTQTPFIGGPEIESSQVIFYSKSSIAPTSGSFNVTLIQADSDYEIQSEVTHENVTGVAIDENSTGNDGDAYSKGFRMKYVLDNIASDGERLGMVFEVKTDLITVSRKVVLSIYD